MKALFKKKKKKQFSELDMTLNIEHGLNHSHGKICAIVVASRSIWKPSISAAVRDLHIRIIESNVQ